jgi:hypothetical protein
MKRYVLIALTLGLVLVACTSFPVSAVVTIDSGDLLNLPEIRISSQEIPAPDLNIDGSMVWKKIWSKSGYLIGPNGKALRRFSVMKYERRKFSLTYSARTGSIQAGIWTGSDWIEEDEVQVMGPGSVLLYYWLYPGEYFAKVACTDGSLGYTIECWRRVRAT